MSRRSPQSRLGSQRFIVRARNQNEQNHGKKRVGLTYIYLLLIQRLVQSQRLPVGRFACSPMTLQAKGSHGQNQAAHQVLGELTIGGRNLYSLPGLTFKEQRALAYCTSAVSDIHKYYNYADNYLEAAVRSSFASLANDIMFGRIWDRGEIWDRVIDIVSISCLTASADVDSRHRDEDEQEPIKDILDQYRVDALALRAQRGRVSRRDTDHWIDVIERGAF